MLLLLLTQLFIGGGGGGGDGETGEGFFVLFLGNSVDFFSLT
jgi:hypothetical protein